MFKDGIGVFLWKLAVALYLIANGVLGLMGGGDYHTILTGTMKFPSIIATIIAVLSLIAGIMVVIEMFGKTIRILDYIALGLAVIWAAYIVIGIISWVTSPGNTTIWYMLQRLGVHTMVLGSLLITARKGNR
ncbi:MAG: hypothetical protein FWC06_02285 [Treponema sp.]|nr:hypothetical protein [Treponema sp.]